MKLTWETILAIAGGIVVLYNASKIIIGLLDPHRKLKDRVDKHDSLLANDHQRLGEIEESNKLLCKSVLVLIEHSITGNSVEKLKSMKSELQNYLINKQ